MNLFMLNKKWMLVAGLLLLATLASWNVVALPPSAGKVILVTGKAIAVSPNGKVRKLKRGAKFYEGDTIETREKSFVKLKYTDGGVMLLRPATKLVIEKYKDPKAGIGESVTNLVKGGLRAVTGVIAKQDRSKYKLKTPVATMGVRGTDFTVRYCKGDCTDLEKYGVPAPADGLYSGVNKGGIVLNNGGGSRLFNAGQYGYVAGQGSLPSLLPGAPAIIAIDNLPDPADSSNKDFIGGNACK